MRKHPFAELFPRVGRFFARRRESHFWFALNRLSRLFGAILPRRDQPRPKQSDIFARFPALFALRPPFSVRSIVREFTRHAAN